MKFILKPNLNRRELEHVARSTVAATVSLLVARMLALPEPYWAVLTTIIIMQSTLGAALTVSSLRLIGTALGAVTAAFIATYFGAGVIVFITGMIAMGLLCACLRLDRSAYRFAGVAFTIVLLIKRDQSPWIVGLHRFMDVAIGILAGLGVTALWPEKAADAA